MGEVEILMRLERSGGKLKKDGSFGSDVNTEFAV
jgi:hypothetical protein